MAMTQQLLFLSTLQGLPQFQGANVGSWKNVQDPLTS